MTVLFGQQRADHRHGVPAQQVGAEVPQDREGATRGGPDSAGMLSTRSESMTATATLALLRNRRRTAGTVVPAAAATDSRDIPA